MPGVTGVSCGCSGRGLLVLGDRAPQSILYLQRRYTTLRLKLPPQESRDRFKALVVIQETVYDFELTAAFTRAINITEAALPRHQAQGQDATAMNPQ